MTPLEIRIEMLKAGVSMGAIARKAEVSTAFVWQVVHGKRKTRRIREEIAAAIGQRIEAIWPAEEKDIDGKP